MANIPEQVLNDLILGNIKVDFEFLALKIMLSRLQQRMKLEPGPVTLQSCMKELSAFFVRFGYLPSVQNDIAKIMKGRV